jgi:hypothetical protein
MVRLLASGRWGRCPICVLVLALALPATSSSATRPAPGHRAAGAVAGARAGPALSSYAKVLQQPAVDAPTDEETLAVEAARFEAAAAYRILRTERVRGRVTQGQFDQQTAVMGPLAGVNRAAFASPIARASLRRGENGEVLVVKSSLAASVDSSIEDLRKTLPPGIDPRPAEAYLADLRQRTRRAIAAQAGASDVIPLAQASGLVQPVQQTQMLMSKGPDWQFELELTTEPGEAIVAFATPSGYSEVFTTRTSRQVLRGLVGYAVLKSGYKKITGKMDLVASSKGLFTCKLVPVSSPDPALPCNAP